MTMECWSCPFSERINGLIGQRVCRELGVLRQKNEGCDLFDAIKTGNRSKFDLIKSANTYGLLQVYLAESNMGIPVSNINITIDCNEITKINDTWLITGDPYSITPGQLWRCPGGQEVEISCQWPSREEVLFGKEELCILVYDDESTPFFLRSLTLLSGGELIGTIINDVDDLRKGDFINGYEIIKTWYKIDFKGNYTINYVVVNENGLACLWDRDDLLRLLRLGKRSMIRKPQ